MDRLQSLYQALTPSARRVFWVIVTIAVLLTGLSIALLESLLLSATLLDLIGVSVPYLLAAIAILSAVSILYNRVSFGVWLFFISTLAAMLFLPFIQEGIAFQAALLVLVVTVLVPLQASTGQKTTATVITGITVSGLIIAIDILWPGMRAKVAPRDEPALQVVTIALGLLLLVSIASQYSSLNLRSKLLVISVGASLLSIIAVTGAATFYSQTALTQNAREKLLTAARHTATAIDDYLRFNLEHVSAEAALPAFYRYLAKSNTERRGLADVQATLQALARRDTENIRSYALLDSNGNIIWDTRTVGLAVGPGKNQSEEDYFRVPYREGKPYISPVRFLPGGTGRAFYISAPVRDPFDQSVVGVLAIELRADLLDDILRENANAAGASSYAILLDEYNLILSDPLHPERTFRSATQLTAAQVAFLQTQKRLPADANVFEISLEMNAFARGLSNINRSPFFTSGDRAFEESMQVAAVFTGRQPWKVAFVQPVSVALAPVLQQTRAITAAALLTSFLLGLATLFLSRTITNPVAMLTRTAEEISAGNLNARAQVRSRDELGQLAKTLNAMSDQLQQTLAGLETTIAERTADLEAGQKQLLERSAELEAANRHAQRRAEQLLAVSTVSNAIATVQNLDELLPLITRTISEKFGFYHVGIFLNDASNQFAVLRAANSPGGQRMLQRGHRLKIGETGIVGNVVATNRPRIALDTGTDAVFFNNPDLPETRSEMALPLRDGPVVIGALDVQSTEPNAFSEEDIEILSALAGQVSTAIRNARLFEEIQRSQAELQTLLQKDVEQQWRDAMQKMQKSGYYYDGAALLPIEKPPATDDKTLLFPITVRGRTIGNLGIRPPTDRPLTQEEMEVIQSVSERLAIAAENARLLEDSQKRAAKEQIIGKISTRISESINLENILQAAVEELGQVLQGSQVSIRLKSGSPPGKQV
ncbi:MAG: GAF domain-containing protein [Anaerolineales bacterium]|nr:GAF domain-containing protein [Anaerolineales bacterium]MDW8278849.1 GAF domain-containing protein [Anaerolineales bacterium]